MQPHLASAATTHPVHFVVFITLVIGFLWVDLASGKTDRPVSMLKAATWSGIWVAVSLAFAGYVASIRGTDDAILFLTAYALEKSLAVDNLFVFLAIFSAFAIPEYLHHRILYWGIIGALIFRAIFIGLGVGLLFGAQALGALTIFGWHIELQRVVFFLVSAWSFCGRCMPSFAPGGRTRPKRKRTTPTTGLSASCASFFPTGLRHSLIAGAS